MTTPTLRALPPSTSFAAVKELVANTPLSEGLRSDVPGTMRPLARTFQDPAIWSAWGHLAHSQHASNR
ncbi:hypothetical protein [Kribbella alba]|uniref:hypothetical protein n=1 Tax=Kribbella alba TaxID=190197 RepID=UPI0031D3EEDE